MCVLGTVLALCTWRRIPADYTIRTTTLDDQEIRHLFELRYMHLAGLVPSLFLAWLQISVLAAIGVALSTRFPLVVNLPAVIMVYIAGNLTRFLEPIWSNVPGTALYERSFLLKVVAQVLAVILPFLELFDLRQAGITGVIALPGTAFASDPQAFALSGIWGSVGLAVLYAVSYVSLVMIIGMIMFQNRELGGGEG